MPIAPKFKDAADFVGWYIHTTTKLTGVAKNDAFNQYLAYHEGQGNYKKHTYKKKPEVIKAAKQVVKMTKTYRTQMQGCAKRLKRYR